MHDQDGMVAIAFVNNTFYDVIEMPAISLHEKSFRNRRSRSESKCTTPNDGPVALHNVVAWPVISQLSTRDVPMSSEETDNPKAASTIGDSMPTDRLHMTSEPFSGSGTVATALVGVVPHDGATHTKSPTQATHGDGNNYQASILPQDDEASHGDNGQAADPSDSQAHASGTCRPCAHFWRSGGCSKGVFCERCHLCDESAWRAYRQQYRNHVRARRALNRSTPQA